MELLYRLTRNHPGSTKRTFCCCATDHRAKKLKDVLKKYHLPVTVRFDTKTRWKFRVGEEVYESNNFGQMHLVKSYVDTYLRTNPIRDGE